MADRYWVGGTGNWSNANTANWAASSGGAGGQSIPTNADNVFFDANSGAGTVTVTSNSRAALNLNFTGYTGTLAGSGSITDIMGSLTVASGMTWSYTGPMTFTSTTSQTITPGGKTFANVTFNGVGGTWALLGNFVSTGTVTLTNGSFNAGGFNMTVAAWVSSNSNTRTVTFGSGTWTVTGNAAVIFNMATSTNATIVPGNPIICNYAGATGTRTISTGALADVTQASALSFNITAGSDIIANSNNRVYGSLDFTGFTGNWTIFASQFYGNLTYSPTMTQTNTGNFSFIATSGTQTITLNGNPNFLSAIIQNGAGGTLTFGSDFSTTSTITVTQGTFNTGGYDISALSFASSNSNTRSITLNDSTVTLTGTGTVWNTSTSTGLTFDAGTSTIKMNDASASSKTFAGGTLTYYNLELAGAGTGTFIIGTSAVAMTLNSIIVTTPPHTVQIFAGKTLTVSSLAVNGTSSSINTFQSTSAGTQWTISSPSGSIDVQYISLRDSNATGGADFNAFNSIDAGNNTGWDFIGAPGAEGTAGRDGNFVPSKLAVLNTDTVQGTTLVPIRINPSNSGILVNTTATISFTMVPVAPRDPNYVPCWLFEGTDGLTYPAVATIDGELLIEM